MAKLKNTPEAGIKSPKKITPARAMVYGLAAMGAAGIASRIGSCLNGANGNDNTPPAEIEPEHVDRIEYNNLYDENGNAVLDQLIFWNLVRNGEDAGNYRVVDWRLVKPSKHVSVYKEIDGKRKKFREVVDNGRMRPRRTEEGWELNWQDGRHTRRVIAVTFSESWTQRDPEIEDRKYRPKEMRRKLQKLP